MLKAVREKDQVTYKGSPIRNTPDFLPETIKARRYQADESTNASSGYYTQQNSQLLQTENRLEYRRILTANKAGCTTAYF